MYNKEEIFDKYKCRITLDALSSIRKKIIVKILWILISFLNNNSYRLSPSWEPLPYKISSRDIIDMLNVRWSSIPIENYQLARNYAEGEGASEIFPRKCRCRKKKRGGETRIGMISRVRMMEKLWAGDAAGFNKETARLVRFES